MLRGLPVSGCFAGLKRAFPCGEQDGAGQMLPWHKAAGIQTTPYEHPGINPPKTPSRWRLCCWLTPRCLLPWPCGYCGWTHRQLMCHGRCQTEQTEAAPTAKAAQAQLRASFGIGGDGIITRNFTVAKKCAGHVTSLCRSRSAAKPSCMRLFVPLEGQLEKLKQKKMV